MKQLLPITLFALLSLFAGCAGNQQGEETEAGAADTSGMEQFAGDEAFRAAHAEPMELDFRGRGQMIRYDVPGGGEQAGAYVLSPPQPTDKYLLVFHEWWGLNEHIKAEVERLYDVLDSTVTVIAPDLYDGQVATTQDRAGELMQSVREERVRNIIRGALNYAGDDAHVGTIGWCFGGGWSLRAGVMAGDRAEAVVMYYGMPVQNAQDLAPLEAPVLGIFASQDDWINEKVVGDFQNLARATNADLTVQWYDAAHAFANPSNPQFNQQAAQEANRLAWAFLDERL